MKKRPTTAFVVVIASTFKIALASAGPCAADIAQFRLILRQQESRQPNGFGTAPQSIAAQLEHQPTPVSVKHAVELAQASISAVVARAEALDAQGNQSECRKAIATARLMLNP